MDEEALDIFRDDPTKAGSLNMDGSEEMIQGMPQPFLQTLEAIESTVPVIMIIDDDTLIRNSLGYALAQDYELLFCSNGEQGIEAVSEQISAVILDIRMQGRDGFETFLEIKKRFSHLPIIFYSAYQNLKDPYEVMNEYRPFGYISKSVGLKELSDIVASAVDYHRQILKNEILIRELQGLNATLQDKVAERTAELVRKNAEIQEDLVTAEALQKQLFTQFTPPPFLKIATRYLPRSHVSGDLYKLYPVGSTHYNLFLGDGTGHGVASALTTFMANTVLIQHGNQSPLKVIQAINTTFEEELPVDRFLAVSQVQISEEGDFETFMAGIPPTIILPADGSEPIMLFSNNPPLGLFANERLTLETQGYKLQMGDKILLHTDGYIEQKNEDDKMIGIDQLCSLLINLRESSVDTILSELLNYLYEVTKGRTPKDDITLIAVEFCGNGG